MKQFYLSENKETITRVPSIYLLFVILLLFQSSTSNSQSFVDVASTFNITSSYPDGYFGGGVSFCDFNGDGWDDITFARGNGHNIQFFQNNNGTLSQITAPLTYLDESKQVLWVDFDNDGDKDFFVTGWYAQNRLFQNIGNFTFIDITIPAGIPLQNDPTFGASFGDFNNDGLLDLYVSNYGFNVSDITHRNYFLQNNGNGTFTNATFTSGIFLNPSLTFCSAFIDINQNLKPDIYLANDKIYANALFKNMNNAYFQNIAGPSGSGIIMDAMNVGPGDYDNDGDLDIYITNNWTESHLLINQGNETFTIAPTSIGVGLFQMGWGGNFFDYDNDTDLDLYVCGNTDQFQYPNAFFVNMGNGNFTEPLYTTGGLQGKDTVVSYSNAIGDFNNDGKLDIAVGNSVNYPFAIWENQEVNTNNWLKVKLEGVVSNRDAIGCWIEIYINNNKYVRYTLLGQAFLAQNSMTHHFGLGPAAYVDSVLVRWPSSTVDRYYSVLANQTLFVLEGSSANPLPIELQSFKAKAREDHIYLSWKTLSEDQFSGFYLQRALDGVNFENIAWLGAQDNENTHSFYHYADQDVTPNLVYYYRLMILNKDESHDFSEIISEKIVKTESPEFRISPNPVNASAGIISIKSTQNTVADIKIINRDGKEISGFAEQKLVTGTNDMHFGKNLASGIYFVSIITKSGDQRVLKLVLAD